MRIPVSVFTIFILVLMSGYLTAYSIFVEYFKKDRLYQAQMQSIEKQLAQEKKYGLTLVYQIQDIQQSIAQELPQYEKIKTNITLKNISSAVRFPASIPKIDFSGKLFREGKNYFSEKKFTQSLQTFEELNVKFPTSLYQVEARFLSMEAYFLTRQYGKSLAVVDEMVTQYPEHDLTGFALLRMGQINELNNKSEEASDVYQSVYENFNNPLLKKQAKELYSHLEKK